MTDYKMFGAPEPDLSNPLDLIGFDNNTKSSQITSATLSQKNYVIDGVDLFHTNDALDLAKSYLQGCYEDYVFFQDIVSGSTSEYCLFIGDIDSDFSDTAIYFNEADGYLFRYVNYYRRNFTDKNGTITFPSLTLAQGSGGASQLPGITEPFTFNILDYIDISSNLQIYSVHVTDYTYSIASDDFLYASFEGHPHLIEGVQNYAFVGLLLCFGFIAFGLFDRIFRRIY